MIELLAAMTVMLIGIFAVFSVFQAGIVQIRRASTVTTAGAIADSEMENFRAIKYEAIDLRVRTSRRSSAAAMARPTRVRRRSTRRTAPRRPH